MSCCCQLLFCIMFLGAFVCIQLLFYNLDLNYMFAASIKGEIQQISKKDNGGNFDQPMEVVKKIGVDAAQKFTDLTEFLKTATKEDYDKKIAEFQQYLSTLSSQSSISQEQIQEFFANFTNSLPSHDDIDNFLKYNNLPSIEKIQEYWSNATANAHIPSLDDIRYFFNNLPSLEQIQQFFVDAKNKGYIPSVEDIQKFFSEQTYNKYIPSADQISAYFNESTLKDYIPSKDQITTFMSNIYEGAMNLMGKTGRQLDKYLRGNENEAI